MLTSSKKGDRMSNYICAKCRKEFELEDKVRCSFCGFRIVSKARPIFMKKVSAR